MTNLQDITAVVGGKLYSGKLRADGKYKLTPLRPEPSRGDSSLAKITYKLLGHDDGVKFGDGYHNDCKREADEAQAAIAELVEGAIPEKRLKRNGEPTTNMATAEWGYNQALKEIRNNLIKVGVLNG